MTSPVDETSRAILQERARQLARPLVSTERATHGVEVLTFTLGRERFGAELRFVVAVFPLVELVPLPGASAPVIGLTRWRGDVLTIVDLRRLIGLPTALDDLSRVIVVGDPAAQFGMLADALGELVTIDPSRLHALPREQRGERTMLLRGVTDDAVHILDLAALMARQGDDRRDVEPSALSPSPARTT